MIVTCPSCGRKFNLSQDAIKSPYQKLKCSRCSHIFMLTTEQPGTAKAEPVKGERATPLGAALEPEGLEAKEPRKRKGPAILVVLLVLLTALGGGFYYYWMNYNDLFGIPMGASDRWLSIKNLVGQEIVASEGKVFFISGTVSNGSTKPRRFLILRSKLFDKNGTVLAEKDVVAGLSLSKESVVTMQKLDVENKINNFKLSSEENFQLGKGKQIPFTVLFFDEGFDKAKEFTVEIIESPSL